MGNAAVATTPDSIPQSTPAPIDISGMPDPPDDLVGTAAPSQVSSAPAAAPAPDISGMPAPTDLFKQQYGRAPKSAAELQTFTSGARDLKYGALDPLVGLGETGLSAVTGLAGQVGGFLAHVGTLLATQDPDAAKAVRDAVQEQLTYQPRSDSGQGIQVMTQAIAKAAWNAAHGPQAKAAVDNALRTHFGDSAADAVESGVGMAGEAAQAVATVAGGAGALEGAAGRTVGDIDVNPHVAPQAADIKAATQPGVHPGVTALAAATPPTPGNQARPVTGADLRAQPDPLAPKKSTPQEARQAALAVGPSAADAATLDEMNHAANAQVTGDENGPGTSLTSGQMPYGHESNPVVAPGQMPYGHESNPVVAPSGRPPLVQGGTDTAQPLYDAQAAQDAATAAANPNGQRPPLQPGVDTGAASTTAQAQRDMANANPVTEPAAAVPPPPAEAQKPKERFIAPQEEGSQRGALDQPHQDSRTSVLQDLNDMTNGALPEVRHSAVTGDYHASGQDFEDAKINDAGGARMGGVISNENTALKTAAHNITEGTGTVANGVDQGALTERGTVVDNALGAIQKWFDNPMPAEGEKPGLIQRLYGAANERAQGTPIPQFTNTAALLGDQTNFMGTAEGEALHRGAIARAQKLGLIGDNGAWKPATVQQAEQFRQWLGDQWTPRTAKMIGKTRDALDSDVAAHAGADIYNQSRAARTLKSKMLDEQPGIAALAQPRDRAGINREVPISGIMDHITNLDRDQFNHVVNVLKSAAHLGNGELADQAAAALNEIKGHMAARLEAAGGSSLDGNWNAKEFYKQADKYSQKLPAVFNDAERAQIHTVNRAGNILRMDKRYQGAAATLHNTGVIQSIRGNAAKAARGGVAVVAHHALPVVGPMLEEATGLGERVQKLVGGDLEKQRAAKIEKNIDQVPPREPPEGGAPLGARVGGGKQRGAVGILNNASGESSASLEAQSRVAQEAANGQHRYSIDPDGNVTPLRGVDSVDATAPPGHVIVQRGVGAQPYSVLDRGGLPASHANGLVARAAGNLADAERTNQRTLGQRVGGGRQRGGPKFTPQAAEKESSMSDAADQVYNKLDPVHQQAVDVITSRMHMQGVPAGQKAFSQLQAANDWSPEEANAIEHTAKAKYAGDIDKPANGVSGAASPGAGQAGAGKTGPAFNSADKARIQAHLKTHLANAAQRLESVRQGRKVTTADEDVPF
jgi:hypothetical protein